MAAKRNGMRKQQTELIGQLRTAHANLVARNEELTDKNVSYTARVTQLEDEVRELTWDLFSTNVEVNRL